MRRTSNDSFEKLQRPPTKHGVGPSTVALPAGSWATIFDFLVERFPRIPRAEWLARIERGDVLNERLLPIAADSRYEPNGTIHYYRHIPDEPGIPFQEEVLFQDDHLVVADKPHFLPVISTGGYVQESLLVRLKRKLRLDHLAPLHRIDRETAGLVLFAIQPDTRGRYMEMFRRRTIEKRYEAIAPYRNDLQLPLTFRNRLVASEHFMQMHAVEGEPNAETGIEILERRGALARYGIRPVTGKRHQIRVHMAALGIPILNDRIYPHLLPAVRSQEEREAEYAKPLQLLAKRIEFVDPLLGVARRFESRRSLIF